MAVFDFTVKITGFGAPERARPLVRVVAETLDRLGFDHLLVDLNRDGDAAWVDAYPGGPIVITGSGPLSGAFERRIRAAVADLHPDAEVSVEWFGHDPARAAVAEVNREIERVARMFRGLARGIVPARVRMAILSTDAYLARYGGAHRSDERRRPAELTLNALYHALSEAGALVGIEWNSTGTETATAFSDLRVLPAPGGERPIGSAHAAFLDRWLDIDEAQFAVVERIDPGPAAQADDGPNAALFDAIRDVLSVVPVQSTDECGPVPADGALDSPDWLGELVVSASVTRSGYDQVGEPIEG